MRFNKEESLVEVIKISESKKPFVEEIANITMKDLVTKDPTIKACFMMYMHDENIDVTDLLLTCMKLMYKQRNNLYNEFAEQLARS